MSKSTTTKASRRRPRVLVLEALSGSSRAVTRAGGIAIGADPRNASKRTLDLIESGQWDALLLTGGSDIDPRRYGAKKPHRAVYGVNEVRDEVEVYALEFARERNVPVLGICRGCQIINVEAGGTLVQHIGEKHRSCWHPVDTKSGSTLRAAAGDRFRVRSLHHQKVRKPAPGFAIVGRAHDGTAEAIESADGRCIGVQFHPEMDTGARYSQGIFRWLVIEAAKRAGLVAPSKPKPPKPRKQPKRAEAKPEPPSFEKGEVVKVGYGRARVITVHQNGDVTVSVPNSSAQQAQGPDAHSGKKRFYAAEVKQGKIRKGQLSFDSFDGMRRYLATRPDWPEDDDPRQLVASTVNGQPRHRPAGTRRFKSAAPVKVSFFCPDCGMLFDGPDAQDNRAAHIAANVCG